MKNRTASSKEKVKVCEFKYLPRFNKNNEVFPLEFRFAVTNFQPPFLSTSSIMYLAYNVDYNIFF